eukprot:TRINITY_DN1236_c0_g1_i3.p1 TRINITY_DN1236_c0_g1~~TRINITY_DN1236_c0_g1_i3.p1  ORF type:complete len:514 (-),score=58.83 TRINITY_DN1236_c0_g1_i3:353-1894(-)
MLSLYFLLLSASSLGASGFSPSSPIAGWSYVFEKGQHESWPQCSFRFASYDEDCSRIDVWNDPGSKQVFHLVSAGDDGFYIKTSCGNYVWYSQTCADTRIGFSLAFEDSPNEAAHKFRFIPTENLGWIVEAKSRSTCSARFFGLPKVCSDTYRSDMGLEMQPLANRWFIHAVDGIYGPARMPNTENVCPDPFAWRGKDGTYRLICTGHDFPLLQTNRLDESVTFSPQGNMLGSEKPVWARRRSRWAPENVEADQNSTNLAVFCDAQAEDGKHRVGWVMSSEGPSPGSWSKWPNNYLDLGGEVGGEIDPHIFTDDSGLKYLVWKSDDNSVGANTTRIWAQPCHVNSSGLTLTGSRHLLIDSTALWWSDSFVAGGSLVEGPEIIKKDGYYYLFFASGKFCTDSYSEGVARSRSVLGPYTKLRVPLLSTAIVGNMVTNGFVSKISGPGHASFVKDERDDWWVVWHASAKGTCERYAFVDRLAWTVDGWPYVDFKHPESERIAKPYKEVTPEPLIFL